MDRRCLLSEWGVWYRLLEYDNPPHPEPLGRKKGGSRRSGRRYRNALEFSSPYQEPLFSKKEDHHKRNQVVILYTLTSQQNRILS